MNLSSLKVPVMLAACALAANATAQITDSLVLHLPFDNNFENSRANAITATAVGNPTFGAGQIGAGAVALTTLKDGSRFDYVTLGYPDLLQFGSVTDGTAVNFSVAFWVNYTNQVDDPPFISNKNWSSSDNQGWGIFTQSGGNFRVNTTDDRGSSGKQNTTSTPNVRDGKWHHIAATFERTNAVRIYVDGTLATESSLANVTGSIDTDPGAYAVNIGQDGSGSYTDGNSAEMVDLLMDDLGIWRRSLTPGEVTAIYNAGLSGTNLANVAAVITPFVKSTTPGRDATGVAANASVSALISDATRAVNTNSVLLLLNGAQAPIAIAKTNSETTVRLASTNYLTVGANTATLIFASDATPPVFVTNEWSFTVEPYTTITPGLKVAADTSKPGFTWTVFANSAVTTDANNRTEAALAGLLKDTDGNLLPNLADPNAQGIALSPASAADPANSPIVFRIGTVLNMSAVGGTTAGNFPNDEQMPGLPATDGNTDGVSAEALTFIELPAGMVAMGINSDDGFKTTIGKVPQDALSSIIVGQYDGDRGAGDTVFYLNVQEAGVYAFRTTYENGSGASGLEWFTLKADGTKVLVNDVANGGLHAYREAATATPAYVKYVSPAPVPRQVNQPSAALLVVLADGTSAIQDNSVTLKVDGTSTGVTQVREGNLLKLTYAPAQILFPADVHTASLTFADSSGVTNSHSWTFLNLKNVVLPAPVYFDNFDSYTEGGLPTGWVQTNYTTSVDAGEDLNNLNSDTYQRWVVVNRENTLETLKSHIFQDPVNQVSNGVPVTSLSSGNLLYAESDVRDGSQVQFLYSKPYDLSAVTNAGIAFGCLYEQNQDNIGAIEYSIDGGKSWLPVVYYLDFSTDGGDIRLNADGSVDAVATFTADNTDTATWTENGVAKGGKYGDGIAAPITQSLGRFVAPREDDNRTEGKRIEIYRLEQAGRQPDVRLRFAQLGTGSWYFGVDNLGFYDVPAASSSTGGSAVLTLIRASDTTLTLSWTGTGTLTEATSLVGPWTTAASQANPQTITVGTGTKFYRINQ